MLSRRRFLQLMGLGALGVAGAAIAIPALRNQPPVRSIPRVTTDGTPAAFDQHQYATLAAAAAVIVPSDDAPGAAEALVADYLDAEAQKSPVFKRQYTEGVHWLDQSAGRRFGGKYFVEITPTQQTALLREMDDLQQTRSRAPSSALDRAVRRVSTIWTDMFGLGRGIGFFITLRDDVFEGFYTNPVAWQMLKYKGPPQPDGYPDYAAPCPDTPATTGDTKANGLAAPAAIRWMDIELEFPYAFGSVPADELAPYGTAQSVTDE